MQAAGVIGEPAPAKLNLALHVRRRRDDGRHDIETLFAFCVDGDRIEGAAADELSLAIMGPFAGDLVADETNLVIKATRMLAEAATVQPRASLRLVKNLPVASGIGGGSADAAATLRLLTRLWEIAPGFATEVALALGSDVPACLLSLTARGTGAGDQLELLNDPDIAGTPVLLVNPAVSLATREVFSAWDGVDRGPLGDWRHARNDLQAPARALVPAIGDVLAWLAARNGATFVRMSGSGATCFALFDGEEARDAATLACPEHWWHLATFLR